MKNFLEKSLEERASRKGNRTRQKNKRGDSKVESNDSPEIPDRGETLDIPGLPSGDLGKGKRTIGNVTLNGVYLFSTQRLSVLITAVLLQLLQEYDVYDRVFDDRIVPLLILLDFTDDNNDPDAERLELRTLDAKYNCLGDEFFDTNTVS